jgi:membrane-bound lytic murein transglycosylase A
MSAKEKRCMNFKFLRHIHICFLLISFASAANSDELIGKGYDFDGNGKELNAPILENVYTKITLPKYRLIIPSDKGLDKVLRLQKRYLRKKSANKKHLVGNLVITNRQLLNTVDAISQWKASTSPLEFFIDAYQIHGEDKRGNVHYTGYFTPILTVRRYKNSEFKYPLYRKPIYWPNKKRLTRHEIDFKGALKGKGLELAWSNNLIDNYFLHVQGSGLVKYQEDGEIVTFMFGGGNGYKYESVGRYLVKNGYISPEKISLDSIRDWFAKNPVQIIPVLSINPSYTFFVKSKESPKGAINVPVTAHYSVAVDSKYIPLGAILIGQIPILDNYGKLSHHEFRILFAQDRGSAIKGAGHIDIYKGVGSQAKNEASALHHYGKLWLIIAKRR